MQFRCLIQMTICLSLFLKENWELWFCRSLSCLAVNVIFGNKFPNICLITLSNRYNIWKLGHTNYLTRWTIKRCVPSENPALVKYKIWWMLKGRDPNWLLQLKKNNNLVTGKTEISLCWKVCSQVVWLVFLNYSFITISQIHVKKEQLQLRELKK